VIADLVMQNVFFLQTISELINVISDIIQKIFLQIENNKCKNFILNSRAFRNDKSIGDYIDELAYILPEEMKYSHIPQCSDEKDENWFEN
jgi:hypothetical protein